MSTLLSRKFLAPSVVFVFLDLFAIGAGMGVPIFAILFGFITGWLAPSILVSTAPHWRQLLRMCLLVACLTASFTFLVMLIIWGPAAQMLFEPAADFANFGMPMLLYEPKASFIGWLLLMIVVSPCLQAIASNFASSVRLAWLPPASLLEPTYLIPHGA